MTSVRSSQPGLHPPQLWGLDVHFNIFNKFYIADILQLKPYPGYPGAFVYSNHPVFKVDVMGVVVRREERHKLFLYSIDDGTGVINCCCWKQPFVTKDGDSGRAGLALLSCDLQQQLATLEREREGLGGSYELGDLVHVRGKLKLYRDLMEIVTYNHRRLDDPGLQLRRMQELPGLYRRCHDAPFCLPRQLSHLGSGVSGAGGATQSHQSLLQRMRDAVLHVLRAETAMVEFSISDLLRHPLVSPLAQQMDMERDVTSAMESVLRDVEETSGAVCLRTSSPPYENLCHPSPLQTMVLAVLREECATPKYAGRGCHYLHVQDEVRRRGPYPRLPPAPLLAVLARLETDSDVIRVTDKLYLPL